MAKNPANIGTKKQPKVTYRDLLLAKPALERLLPQELEAKIRVHIARRIRAINAELLDYERLRVDLVKKFGDPVEGQAGNYKVREADTELYTNELAKIEAVEITLTTEPFALADLETAKITVGDMVWLLPLTELGSET